METVGPTRARAFFDSIRSATNGVEFLRSLVNSEVQAFESEFLDFKSGHDLMVSQAKISELYSLWAKSLSCFANSDGGVLIFGIDAPKGAAKSIALVPDASLLRDRLKGVIQTITEPPVQRVEIEVYPERSGSKEGFVVCYIPASPWRPHQTKAGGQPGQFYIRAADNCVPCSHSTLRALFAPRFVAKLDVYYRVTVLPLHIMYDVHEVAVQCWLYNDGPATAREVFVRFELPPNVGAPRPDLLLWKETTSARPGNALTAERSLHPEEMVKLFQVNIGRKTKNGEMRFESEVFPFSMSISAQNQPPLLFEFEVRREDADDSSRKRAVLVERASQEGGQ